MNEKLKTLLIDYVIYNMIADEKINFMDYLCDVMNYSLADASILYMMVINCDED